jgi:predicted nucleic acid-binding protein
MYLLDMNVISELRKPRPHGGVIAWFKSVPASLRFLPSISLYEMQSGVELTRVQDMKRAEEIHRWIDEVQAQWQVLPLDGESARLAARLMHGRSAALTADAMIAAIARVKGFTVVTRNVADFETLDVSLLNPFEYED